jgi:Fur family ferric uptake transcriptional regulator
MTQQRRAILNELCRTTAHPTADELYRQVREQLPHVSLGTVYRNLETLSVLGLIQKLEMAGSQRRYDGNPEPHDHARCLSCGAIADIPNGVRRRSLPDRDLNGFRVTGYRLELLGNCAKCSDGSSNTRQ